MMHRLVIDDADGTYSGGEWRFSYYTRHRSADPWQWRKCVYARNIDAAQKLVQGPERERVWED